MSKRLMASLLLAEQRTEARHLLSQRLSVSPSTTLMSHIQTVQYIEIISDES